MEKRSRGRPATIVEGRTTRASSKSPSRRSSARDRSPVRKSPARKSPARKSSPSRSKAASTQRRSGRNKLTDNDTASETDDSKSEGLTKLSVRVSPLKFEKDGTVRTPTKGLRSKASNISSEGDDEVASLTSKYLSERLRRRAVVEDPTPSDLSTKRSYSRSISRSVVEDEEWSHSDTSEKNDGLYNRITRSRSKSQKVQRASNDPAAEFGGSIGAFALVLLIPIVCFSAQYVCSRPDCNIKSVRWEKLKALASYFTNESVFIFLSFHWIVSLVSTIPYTGLRRTLPQSATSDAKPLLFNGLFTSALITSGLLIAEYVFQHQIFALIYKNYQQLILVSFVYALLISTTCFIRSRYVPVSEWNPLGKSGRLVSDFFMGRIINPEFFGIFNIKLIHRRMALITILVINIVFLVRNIKYVAPAAGAQEPNSHPILAHLSNINGDSVAALVSSILITYVVDQLVYEHHSVNSLELSGDGTGAYQLLYYASFPVLVNLWAKYANQHKIADVPCYLLVIIGAIAAAGILFKRYANYIKYNFRTQPKSASASSKSSYFLMFLENLKGISINHNFFPICHIEYATLPTFQGKYLLIEQCWGVIRHPNILGDLVVALSVTPLLYFRFAWPPLIATGFIVLALVHRARRIDNHMARQYSTSWDKYKIQVPKSLIPRVY